MMWCVLLTGVVCAGCDISPYVTADSRYDLLLTDVQGRDYESAGKVISYADLYVTQKDQVVLEYNRAVLEILHGNCHEATELLNRVISQETNVSYTAWSDKHESLETDKTVEDIYRLSYQALSLAERCPFEKNPVNSGDDEQALAFLYEAYRRGLDVREQISWLLAHNRQSCHEWITDPQLKSSSPDAAVELSLFRQISASSYVVCPGDGIWFKVSAHAHDKLYGRFDFAPIERLKYTDESEQLQFAQFHLDVFDEIPVTGKDLTPVYQYRQPLPENMLVRTPTDHLTVDLPELVASSDGEYYIHVYPERNGEAVIYPVMMRRYDCRYQDDTMTYDAAFKNHVIGIDHGDIYRDLILCNDRPDVYTFDLSKDQHAMFTIETQDSRILDKSFVRLLIERENKAPVEVNAETNHVYHDSTMDMMVHYPVKAISGTEKDPLYLLFVQYHARHRGKYRMTLLDADGMSYEIRMVKSSPCSDKEDKDYQLFDAEHFDQNRGVMSYPMWQCGAFKRQYLPQMKRKDELLRGKLTLHHFSWHAITGDDVRFAYMMNQNKTDYLIESGREVESCYSPETPGGAWQLYRPIMRDTLVSVETSKSHAGFSVLTFEPNQDGQKDSDSDQENEQKPQDSKDDSKDDKTASTQGQSKDKPSDEKTSMLGAGSDTYGRESNPDVQASGNQAGQYDPESLRRDHIDALLDAIEQGDYYVPLGGNQDRVVSDKNW